RERAGADAEEEEVPAGGLRRDLLPGAVTQQELAHVGHDGRVVRRQISTELDDARIAALDERAAATGRSRSDLIREAVDLLLGSGADAAIDAEIVAGYERRPPAELDAWARCGAIAAIAA